MGGIGADKRRDAHDRGTARWPIGVTSWVYACHRAASWSDKDLITEARRYLTD
jgi:hypothetical protein